LTSIIFDQIEGIIYLSSAILASILFALSVSAYRKRFVKKILCAVSAFGFFAFYLFFEAFEAFTPELNSYFGVDLFAASIITLVLIFFFLALVKK
jgi:hypothetical protein